MRSQIAHSVEVIFGYIAKGQVPIEKYGERICVVVRHVSILRIIRRVFSGPRASYVNGINECLRTLNVVVLPVKKNRP